MIGLSLSQCIRDILLGNVDEDNVRKIFTGTKVTDLKDWDFVLHHYAKNYWYANPVLGQRIAWRFIALGKIDQPRVRGEESYFTGEAIWVENEEALAGITRFS